MPSPSSQRGSDCVGDCGENGMYCCGRGDGEVSSMANIERAVQAIADLERWDTPPKVRDQGARRAIKALADAGLEVVDAATYRGAVETLREIAAETREPFVSETKRRKTWAAQRAQAALDRLGGR